MTTEGERTPLDDAAKGARAGLPGGGPPVPLSQTEWMAFAACSLVSVAIWVPTMAAYPRYSYEGEQGSLWYFPLMILAAVVLGAVLSREWQVVAAGLVVPQLVLAPWTTPRGDGDGLWALIFPMLSFYFVVAWALAGLSGGLVNRIRRARA